MLKTVFYSKQLLEFFLQVSFSLGALDGLSFEEKWIVTGEVAWGGGDREGAKVRTVAHPALTFPRKGKGVIGEHSTP